MRREKLRINFICRHCIYVSYILNKTFIRIYILKENKSFEFMRLNYKEKLKICLTNDPQNENSADIGRV